MKKLEIESFFKMPFDQIIKELHWNQRRSINSLSEESGISRYTLTTLAKNHKLKLRGNDRKVTSGKGKNHWNYGNKDPDQSNRMRINNPAKNIDVAIRITKTRADYYRKNQWPQEIEFGKLLKKLGVVALEQHPIGIYTIDFYLEPMRIAIEIDSSDKWGAEKRLAAKKRDTSLSEIGIKTIRINKRFVSDSDRIINILKTNNIIG